MTDDKTTDPSRRTMKEVSHTNPYTGHATGQLFSRGPAVAADGGHERTDEQTNTPEQMADDRGQIKDVSHTAPTPQAHVNQIFERGQPDNTGTRNE